VCSSVYNFSPWVSCANSARVQILLRVLVPSLWRRRSFEHFAANLRAADYDVDAALRTCLPKPSASGPYEAAAAAQADAELRGVWDGTRGMDWATLRRMLEKDPARRIGAEEALDGLCGTEGRMGRA
jgi:hypothetical protein